MNLSISEVLTKEDSKIDLSFSCINQTSCHCIMDCA